MIVYHVAITAADDYLTRREAHRRAHLERLERLRAGSVLVGGGPAPDGRTADVVYRLQREDELKPVVEEDPYWAGRVWQRWAPRSFTEFVEPWELPPIVLDGSRRVTVAEGPVLDAAMAQLALVELRGAGRLVFGGCFEGGETFALLRSTDGDEAVGWLADTGFWRRDALRARPLLYVL